MLERYSSSNPNAYKRGGGKRPGAGRKPIEWHKFAERMLEKMEPEKRLMACLNSGDARLNFEIFRYLVDRVLGKPAQTIVGDPNRPVAVQLTWGGARPDWLEGEVVNVTPETEKLEP